MKDTKPTWSESMTVEHEDILITDAVNFLTAEDWENNCDSICQNKGLNALGFTHAICHESSSIDHNVLTDDEGNVIGWLGQDASLGCFLIDEVRAYAPSYFEDNTDSDGNPSTAVILRDYSGTITFRSYFVESEQCHMLFIDAEGSTNFHSAFTDDGEQYWLFPDECPE